MTPSIKHKDAEDSVMKAGPSATPSFPFFRLPPEIINRVFLFACRLPPLTSSTATTTTELACKRWHLTLDLPMTLCLAQVSKSVHKIATQALYSSIRLTAPSDVIYLLRTLRVKPELGKLAKSLHIGADETFKASEWPLLLVRTDEKGVPLERLELWLKSSQRKRELLPKWCEVGRAWRLDPGGMAATAAEEREGAMAHAIEAAMRDVDVDPYRRGYAKSNKQKIGLEEWAIRLYLLQASLDMYLLQLRRIDDIEPSSATLPYPGLTITPSTEPKPPKWDRKDSSVKFTLGLLWLKLVERGGTLDQFDHPIIFARTDLEATEINDYGHELIRKRLAGPHVEHFPDPDEDDAPIIIDSDSEASDSGRPTPAYRPSAAPNHCIPGVINRVTDLLLLTPNVTNLSINGYLHLCLCLDIPILKGVRSLCLSPLLPFWERLSEILFDEEHGPKLEGVESLMISGEGLGNEEAESLAGGKDGGQMPNLKNVTWEAVHTMEPGRRPTASPERTYDLICRLQGQHLSHRTIRDVPPRHFEVRVHPDTLPAVLECATPAMRAAWTSGQPFAGNGPNAVKVVESVAAKVGLRDGGEGSRKLHEGAREWWEAGALLRDEEGEEGGEEGQRGVE